MSRAVLIISSADVRRRAQNWVDKAPLGTRIEFKGPRRTVPQSDKMWAMLTEVATQKDHHGRKYTPDQWKVLFLHACGREVQFIPALDGSTFIPWGSSSSDLSKTEMSDLIEFIGMWGATNGVVFSDQEQAA